MLHKKMEFKNVSKNCLKEWYILRIFFLLLFIASFVVIIFIPATEKGDVIAKTICLIILGMFLLWLAIYAIVFPNLQYKRLQYRISGSRVEKESGVIFLRREFMPFVRMQHVEIYRGIFDRIFKMSTVILYTAGSVVRIQNLNIDAADELVQKIKKLLENEARGDIND